jgi:tetratricopeptide (TPR) repeat protein
MARMKRILLLCLVLSLAAPSAVLAAEGPQAPASAKQGESADDKQVALDALLKELKNAGDEKSATVIEEAVWQLWLRSGSDTVDLLMSRVIGAMKEEDYSLALDLLNHIVELKPGYAEGWNKRATVFFQLQDYARSLHDVERTLALEPRHFGALAGLGLILEELGEDEKALKAFRRALAVHPFLKTIRKEEKKLSEEIEGRGI